jgi:hypothetical protein
MSSYKEDSADAYESERLEMEAYVPPEDGSAAGDTNPEPDEKQLTQAEIGLRCARLIKSDSILDGFGEDLRRSGTFAGNPAVPKVLFLGFYSRLLARPVSILVRGESSAGKSFAVKTAAEFMAPGSIYTLTAMSNKALAYGSQDLRHRTMVLHEADALKNEEVAKLLRPLLSEGRLIYEFVDFEDGRGTKIVEREGPTNVVTTTTSRIDYELNTRFLSINVDSGPELTKAILVSTAALAEGHRSEIDRSEFHWLDHYVAAGPRSVVIPYATKVAAACDPTAVRIRRDLNAVFGLTSAHALLHQNRRPRAEDGSVVATAQDYEAVHGLVAESISLAAGATVPPGTRRLVEKMTEMGGGPLSIPTVADRLKLHRTTVQRDAIAGETLGLVENTQPKGKKKMLVLGEPLLEDRSVLPAPADLDLDS